MLFAIIWVLGTLWSAKVLSGVLLRDITFGEPENIDIVMSIALGVVLSGLFWPIILPVRGIYLLAKRYGPQDYNVLANFLLNKHDDKPKKVKGAKVPLSFPSQKIYDLYMSLPEKHRAMGDIVAMLTALDIKHEPSANDFYQSFDELTCHYSHYNNSRCKYRPYHDLYETVSEVKEAVATQEKTLRMAGVADRLAEAEVLMERMRIEREIIDQTTKELS